MTNLLSTFTGIWTLGNPNQPFEDVVYVIEPNGKTWLVTENGRFTISHMAESKLLGYLNNGDMRRVCGSVPFPICEQVNAPLNILPSESRRYNRKFVGHWKKEGHHFVVDMMDNGNLNMYEAHPSGMPKGGLVHHTREVRAMLTAGNYFLVERPNADKDASKPADDQPADAVPEWEKYVGVWAPSVGSNMSRYFISFDQVNENFTVEEQGGPGQFVKPSEVAFRNAKLAIDAGDWETSSQYKQAAYYVGTWRGTTGSAPDWRWEVSRDEATDSYSWQVQKYCDTVFVRSTLRWGEVANRIESGSWVRADKFPLPQNVTVVNCTVGDVDLAAFKNASKTLKEQITRSEPGIAAMCFPKPEPTPVRSEEPSVPGGFAAQITATVAARGNAYGSPAENHQTTADMLSTWLSRRLNLDVRLSAEDVCTINIIQKVSRAAFCSKDDTWLDVAGYVENIALIRNDQRNHRVVAKQNDRNGFNGTLCVGDVVRLKSGNGCDMTINRITHSTKTAECVFFDGDKAERTDVQLDYLVFVRR